MVILIIVVMILSLLSYDITSLHYFTLRGHLSFHFFLFIELHEERIAEKSHDRQKNEIRKWNKKKDDQTRRLERGCEQLTQEAVFEIAFALAPSSEIIHDRDTFSLRQRSSMHDITRDMKKR